MKLGHAAAVLIGSVALVHGVARAAEPTVSHFKSSSPWELSPGGDSCVLSRNFESGAASLFLRMRTYAPGYNFDFTLAGSPIPQITSAKAPTITFGSGNPLRFGVLASGSSGAHGPAMVFNRDMSLQPPALDDKTVPAYPDPALESGIDRFTIDAADHKVLLDTGSMAPVMQALRQCTDKLVAGWGLDPAVQAKLSRPPRPVNASAVNAMIVAGDPPAAVKALGGLARVGLRVMIDETGAPTGCKTFPTDGVPEFDVKACNFVMKNARYDPALDEQGKAVSSYLLTAIVFATSDFFRSR
ncbi:energy transducer TonB [Novosphingobium sp. BL-52-GroH]|uniref:energy transducer TonB n=1 Tax=Novosphingobium sp. BL-52-GroH TaxID=3349877 RepID=UPI00384D7912